MPSEGSVRLCQSCVAGVTWRGQVAWMPGALSELCGRGDLALLGCLDAAQIPSKASQSVQGV